MHAQTCPHTPNCYCDYVSLTASWLDKNHGQNVEIWLRETIHSGSRAGVYFFLQPFSKGYIYPMLSKLMDCLGKGYGSITKYYYKNTAKENNYKTLQIHYIS